MQDKVVTTQYLGRRLLVLGSFYTFVMLARYIFKMSLYPTERWFGGCLPIFFHLVLAAFLLTNGLFHLRNPVNTERPPKYGRILWNSFYTLLTLLIPVWVMYQLLPTLLAAKMDMRRPEYYVSDFKKLPVQMDDGELLYADLYRPGKLESAPTILVRIPLDNTIKGRLLSNMVGRIWAERGYNVLIQGVRGRFNSKGKHVPFVNERTDGIATLKWLNQQPWHNGKTGMWGGSYFGYTQWVLSDQDTLGLKAMFTHISSSDMYKMFYPGKTFAYESALFWATRSYSGEDTPMEYERLKKGFEGGKMIEADNRVVQDIPFYNDWVTHTERDSYWRKVDGFERAKQLKVPVLMMAGWYDPFLNAQVQDFEEVRKEGDSTIANACRLIIGPWTHAETVQLPNGYQAKNYRLASIAPAIGWYDLHLKGIAGEKIPPVQIFVMGINQWRYENSFPLERTKYTSYYLGIDSSAMDTEKKQRIDTVPFQKLKIQTYLYDPADPIPSIGGVVLGGRAGPKPQNELATRKDILFYNSAILQEDLEVTGKIKLVLYVSTNAKNTDFMGKLVDVHPDGKAYTISEGALRKYYSGKDQKEQIEIELSPTSNVFLKGHVIRLEISSSNYPRFSLNYNTGGNNFDESKGIVAEQKLYTGGIYSSQLVLPVIPSKAK